MPLFVYFGDFSLFTPYRINFSIIIPILLWRHETRGFTVRVMISRVAMGHRRAYPL